MGLEEVVDEILRKANAEREAILKDAKAKAADVQKAAEKEIAEKKSLAAADVENIKSAYSTRELADAELKCKKQVQDARKELIDAAYAGMKAKISAMSDTERKKILEKLFEQSRAEIGEIGRVFVSPADMKIASALFRAKKINVMPREILGGIVAESADGTVMADYSFDTLIGSMKERTIKDVSRILFR